MEQEMYGCLRASVALHNRHSSIHPPITALLMNSVVREIFTEAWYTVLQTFAGFLA